MLGLLIYLLSLGSKAGFSMISLGKPYTLVSAILQYSLRKLLGFIDSGIRFLTIGLHFFTLFPRRKSMIDRVDQNPMATGTVGPIEIQEAGKQ